MPQPVPKPSMPTKPKPSGWGSWPKPVPKPSALSKPKPSGWGWHTHNSGKSGKMGKAKGEKPLNYHYHKPRLPAKPKPTPTKNPTKGPTTLPTPNPTNPLIPPASNDVQISMDGSLIALNLEVPPAGSPAMVTLAGVFEKTILRVLGPDFECDVYSIGGHLVNNRGAVSRYLQSQSKVLFDLSVIKPCYDCDDMEALILGAQVFDETFELLDQKAKSGELSMIFCISGTIAGVVTEPCEVKIGLVEGESLDVKFIQEPIPAQPTPKPTSLPSPSQPTGQPIPAKSIPEPTGSPLTPMPVEQPISEPLVLLPPNQLCLWITHICRQAHLLIRPASRSRGLLFQSPPINRFMRPQRIRHQRNLPARPASQSRGLLFLSPPTNQPNLRFRPASRSRGLLLRSFQHGCQRIHLQDTLPIRPASQPLRLPFLSHPAHLLMQFQPIHHQLNLLIRPASRSRALLLRSFQHGRQRIHHQATLPIRPASQRLRLPFLSHPTNLSMRFQPIHHQLNLLIRPASRSRDLLFLFPPNNPSPQSQL